jgi:acetyltransferase-like isoleucine patch superfamily enzyme
MLKGLRDPLKAYDALKLLAKGQYYKLKYRLLGKDVRIGKNFKVRARLIIKGPGRVSIGDNAVVDGTSHAVTPWTANKDAEIIIGNNVFLNGTRFGCARRIEVGDNCILADCRLLDTDFHSVNPQKRNAPEHIESSPIKIGSNVWISLGCVILKGVTIGENSTIAAQSVVYGDVEKDAVYGGNPAVLIKRLHYD